MIPASRATRVGIVGPEVRLDPDHPQRAQPRLAGARPTAAAPSEGWIPPLANASASQDDGLAHQRSRWQRPGREKIELYRHDQAASAQHRCLPPQHRGRVRNVHQDQPTDDRIERPARRRVVDVALNEPHLRQAALFGPEPGPGQRLRRAVDADDVAIRSRPGRRPRKPRPPPRSPDPAPACPAGCPPRRRSCAWRGQAPCPEAQGAPARAHRCQARSQSRYQPSVSSLTLATSTLRRRQPRKGFKLWSRLSPGMARLVSGGAPPPSRAPEDHF